MMLHKAKYILIAGTASVLASTFTHAQERVVMPDRQSIELSGQISALKSLLKNALKQNNELADRMDVQDVTIQELKDQIANLGVGDPVSGTGDAAKGWHPDYIGKEITCEKSFSYEEDTAWAGVMKGMRIYTAGARITELDQLPQTAAPQQIKYAIGGTVQEYGELQWVTGRKANGDNQYSYAEWEVEKDANGYTIPKKLTAYMQISVCREYKDLGSYGLMCMDSKIYKGSCTANW